jgi:hypothetical protein
VRKRKSRILFFGEHGIQLAIAEDAVNLDHLVAPEDAVRIAMSRQ